MSLSRRMAILIALGSALTSLLVASVAVLIARDALIRSVDAALLDRLILIAATPEARAAIFDRSARASTFADANGPLLLIDAIVDGSILPGDGITATVPVSATTLTAPVGAGVIVESVTAADGERVRVASVRISDRMTVRTMRSIGDVDAVLRRIALAVGLVGIAVSVTVGLAGIAVAARLLRPMGALAATAARVARTQDLADPGIDSRVAARGDEVGQLALAMRGMLGALAASRREQQALLDNAAHELRTPLTSARANVDLLGRAAAQGRRVDEQTMSGIVADLDAELGELATLIEEVVAVAQSAHQPAPVEEIALDELTAEVIARIERRTGRPIVLHRAPVLIGGPRVMVERALGNIIGNAVKFSPPEAVIEVQVGPAGVVVDDGGPGIPEPLRPLVTQRFWRSPEVRGLPGSGLGLAIAADVARGLGGSLTIEDSPLGGARVMWTVPTVGERVAD